MVYVPDQYKAQEMCNKAVKKYPWILEYVADNFKKQKMKAVKKNPHRLSKKGRVQKAKIKEELMSIAWHPARWWGWCVPDDEKKETKIMEVSIGFFAFDDQIQKNLTLTRSNGINKND